MAGLAAWRRGHALGPVGPVTAGAVSADLPVGRLALFRVATRAGLLALAGVWLVAAGAGLVPSRRGQPLLDVAGGAGAGDVPADLRSAVGLMAALALLMSFTRGARLPRVTTGAGRAQRLWLVRQPLVTALTVLVRRVSCFGAGATAGGGEHHLLLMAAAAQALIALLDHKPVGRVTARALHPLVERAVRRGLLVAVAASPRRVLALLTGRVRIVAADALADLGGLGVVWVHAAVAARTGSLDVGLYGVRLVTRGALLVLLDLRATEQVQIRVARSAGHGAGSFKRVGLMTAHAGAVPACEQRAAWHQRLLLGVAIHAGVQRGCRPSVLMLMAGRTDLHARVLACAVRQRSLSQVVVAGGARRGVELHVGVGLVAAHARRRAVHHHRRRRALWFRVASKAVFGAECVAVGRGWRQVRGERRRRARLRPKGMTAGAVGLHARPKALDGCLLRVDHAALLGVASSAALRTERADAIRAQGVALVTRDALVPHVHSMPQLKPSSFPLDADVDAISERSRAGLVGARGEQREGEHKPEQADLPLGTAPSFTKQDAARIA